MHKLLVCSLLVLLCFSACDSKRVYDQYKSLPGEWHKDSIVSFTVKEMDTIKTYDLFINLRNNSDYKYNNIFLIADMNFPNGKVITDTLEYEMAFPNGDWMGKGFGEVKESKLWYKEGVRFSEEGEYKVNIQHAMRKNGEVEGIQNLEGITEVGFRIEKSN